MREAEGDEISYADGISFVYNGRKKGRTRRRASAPPGKGTGFSSQFERGVLMQTFDMPVERSGLVCLWLFPLNRLRAHFHLVSSPDRVVGRCSTP